MDNSKAQATELKLEDMMKGITVFWDIVKRQGFSIALLMCFMYYMHTEKVKLEEQVNTCNSNVLELYKERETMVQKELIELNKTLDKQTVLLENFVNK